MGLVRTHSEFNWLLILLINESHIKLKLTHLFVLSIMILTVLVSTVFIRNQIYFEDHVKRANAYFVNASLLTHHYNSN